MKTIALQYVDGKLIPYAEEDREKLRNYKPNQILRAEVSGIKKPRSYEQLKLYWSLCKMVAENTDDVNWNTSEKVSLQIKIALGYYDTDNFVVKPDGTAYLPVRSIGYEHLTHMEACRYFDRAFEVMAKRLGITVEEIMKNVEQ